MPQKIEFLINGEYKYIEFVYDATGAKLRKIARGGNYAGTVLMQPPSITDYVNGVEYKNGALERVAHAEGSLSKNANTGVFELEYVLRDHLGNTRVTFSDSDNDGHATAADIKQINHYYPFGLNMEGNWNGAQGNNKYQYNEKEWNDDFGLGWNDYSARFYDPAMSRWVAIDPLAAKFPNWSPYNYAFDNPMRFVDPDGREAKSTIVKDNGNGNYTVTGGNANDGDKGVYVDNGKGGKGKKIGESLTSHSFFDENNNAIVGAQINTNSREGQDFIDKEIVQPHIGLINYTSNAKGGERLDFKRRGMDKRAAGVSEEQHMYRGSVTSSGKIGSARDFGNVGAGIVSARAGLDWAGHRLGCDALQSWQQGKLATEGVPTQLAQKVGFSIGEKLHSQDSYNSSFRPFQNNTIYHVDF